MIRQRNNLLWDKFNGLSRYLLVHSLSGVFPYYVVNEYPRSGGSWLGSMLAEMLCIPFPRNRLPVLGKSIMHGHMMHGWNLNNLVLVWRDGRDLLVSQYFHYLVENDRGNAQLVKQTREALQIDDVNDIAANLPVFMEFMYSKNRHPRFTWKAFVDRWAGYEGAVHIHYETLLENTGAELANVLFHLTGKEQDPGRIAEVVEKHSFKRVSGRQQGEENTGSFARKGISGDWKNYFDRDACAQFAEFTGDSLYRLGYENDESWLDQDVSRTILKASKEGSR